jgi:NAD-dependent DNA ligase
MQSRCSCEEIEQKMDELAREYHNTHDPEIPEQILDLARRLRKIGPLKGTIP